MGIFSSDEEPCWSDVYNLQAHNRKYVAKIKRLEAECDMYKTFYRAKHSDIKGLLFKYKQTLQKIKEIANYWQNRWWNDIDERQGFDEILELITQAESEG